MLRANLGTIQRSHTSGSGQSRVPQRRRVWLRAFFGDLAGNPKQAYYSFDLGRWHVISLNSECMYVGGCGGDSEQGKWLQQDLAKRPTACTLAYFHKTLFSSGLAHCNDPEVKPFWDILYHGGADVIVNGHDHDYERFAAQDPNGKADPEHGIREFVVGAGGKNSHRVFAMVQPNSKSGRRTRLEC